MNNGLDRAEDIYIGAPAGPPPSTLEELLQDSWWHDVLFVLSETSFATHDFFRRMDAVAGLFPITTQTISSPMGAGSDSLPVKAAIQGAEIYLPDSLQFVLELGCRVSGKPCYYLMPSFRGEQADQRHLCEFFHAEVEVFGGLQDVMGVAENFVLHLTQVLLQRCGDVIARHAGTTRHAEAMVLRGPRFPQIRFAEACMLLAEAPGAIHDLPSGVTITPAGERELLKAFGDFVWLTHMPWSSVPFYQKRETDTRFALNADLLAGYGEILGSGERAADGGEVLGNLAMQGVATDAYGWYVDMKTRHHMQTAGFGLGIERYLMWLLACPDIRRLAMLRRQWGERFVP
ncbi:Asparagine--tRNA ligase [Xylophilus ampelinus]|nr:Asparagine--tRNA ligase [Xylophilus ampelinus]